MNLNTSAGLTDYLLGRRFEFADGSAPDVTVTGLDVQRGTVRVHAADGGREYLPLADVVRGILAGLLVESETGLPFVLERVPADRGKWWRPASSLRVGVAGTGKRLLRPVGDTGRWEAF